MNGTNTTTNNSKSVYDLVTSRIINDLQAGVIPWEKPWTGTRTGAFNRISKRPYSLLNQMLLGKDGEWATFKQWADLGGHVKKGEKGSIVTFWKVMQIEEKDEEGTTEKKTIPLLRYYTVFHISQVEGVEPLQEEELNDINPIESAEDVFTSYITREGIKFEQKTSNRAYYSPARDLIHLPLIEQFTDSAEYYSVAFHEATHSTGHKTRLQRLGNSIQLAAFGSEDYSKEELVAELGSSFIMNRLGIATKHSNRNNAAYIQSWLKVLKNDTRFIISAASKAEKAANYILEDNVIPQF